MGMAESTAWDLCSPSNPSVYFARAVDGLDRGRVLSAGREVAVALAGLGVQMIDPVAAWDRRLEDGVRPDLTTMIRSDLALLRKADGLLVDMSIPDRNYVGCVCELTYAYQWRIPAVVWVGDTGFEERAWLRYHATAIVGRRAEAVAALAAVLSLRGDTTGSG